MRLTDDQQALFDALPDAVAVVDPSGEIIAVNQTWKIFSSENSGDTNTFYKGRNYFAICDAASGESHALAKTAAKGLAAVLTSSDQIRCEYPCHSKTERRWFEMIMRPFRLGDARCALVIHHNITTRKLQQFEIAESTKIANELAALVATSTDAIISFDLEGRIVSWNQAAEKMYGYKRHEILGQSIDILYPDDWPKQASDYIDEIVAGTLTHFEVVKRTKSGALRNVAISAAAIRSQSGEIVAISHINRDVTEQKRQAERQEFITRELTHRTRNLLTVMSAIEHQTAKYSSSVEDFHERFSARLASLLASNDLLVAADWASVPMAVLVQRQLAAFLHPEADNVRVDGPGALLKPEAVQALGMSFHELATNAVKYGALSRRGGNLSLTWHVSGRNRHRKLKVEWEETGVSVADPAGTKGFGHTVLTSLAMRSLGAECHYDLCRDGVFWSADIPDSHFDLSD